MKSDIQISNEANLINIKDVAKKCSLSTDEVLNYGKYKAKIELNSTHTKKGKLILVTAINPTPAGEGKTTTTIGLHEAFRSEGYNSIVALREPSLGPVFGVKGGATGGGYAQVAPIEDINLHFTGDLHAITSANNLIAAMVDNHIFHGNELDISKVTWKRCVDINDRALRKITLHSFKRITREDEFTITAASEMMAVFCLASSLEDLQNRIDQMIIGFNSNNYPIFVKDLKVSGAIVALLKDSFAPNLVQTLENNPAIIHGGPFANIAHGCNSVVATNAALKLADYVITEAGFGADLGAEKFFNIKCRQAKLKPSAVVLVATIRALKMQGGVLKDDLNKEDVPSLKRGLENLGQHVKIIRSFKTPFIIAINKFTSDSHDEIFALKQWAFEHNITIVLSDVWALGGAGGKEIVHALLPILREKEANYTYNITDSLEEKIQKVATTIYGASGVEYSPIAKEKIALFEQQGLANKLICIAKTPNSLSDDPNLLGAPKNWKLKVSDLNISNGAGFIVIQCGNVMLMPGLSKEPQALKIKVENNKITGLS